MRKFLPRPHDRRRPGRQSTSRAPGITLFPRKKQDGRCFIVLQLESQRQQNISSEAEILWQGSIQRLDADLYVQIMGLAEHQHHVYGDEWDLRDLKTQVLEARKLFTSNARAQIKNLTTGK